MNIKDMVENPHPIHKRYYDFWNFLLQSYEGGIDYSGSYIPNKVQDRNLWDSIKVFVGGKEFRSQLTGNLFKHPKEKMEDYEDRLRMSYYYNFCAPIVEIYTNHLFKQPVLSDFGSLENIIDLTGEDIDRQGSSIEEFRKEMADLAQIYGHIYVLVDRPATNTPLLNLQDQIDLGAFPYMTFFHPQSVINWSLDALGRTNWVLLCESGDSNPNPASFNREAKTPRYYRLWTRDDWFLFDEEYNQVSAGHHGNGFVPIACVFDKKSKKNRNFLGISSIADISLIARDIYNSCSELKQILRDQTFAFLAVQGTSDEYQELSVGTSKGLLYPEGRNVPQYVSPPESNAETYFKHIDRQIEKIFQIAKLEGGSAQFKGQGAVEQSGVSKAWDFNQTNSALSKKASNLEDGETKIWQMFAAWEGTGFDGHVNYPNEFSIQSLMEDLNEAKSLLEMNLGKMFNVEVKKAIIKKKWSRMPDNEVEKMVKEMEQREGAEGSGRLRDMFPGIFNRSAQNANSGGKNGG